MLERRVLELDLGEHVEFDDRFLSVDELADLLAATDVFVTPVREPGAELVGLAHVRARSRLCRDLDAVLVRAGLLSSGAGTLVEFGDPTALGAAVCDYIEAPETLAAARARSARASARRSAGRRSAKRPRSRCARPSRRRPGATPIAARELELPDARTDHLLSLVDDCGIVQHAHGAIPNRLTGYCVDDVARLAVVALELERRTGDRSGRPFSTARSRSSATRPTPDGAGMRNFMSYDRRWLDEPHVGDHVGRSIWALGDVLATAWAPALVEPTRRLLDALVRSLDGELPLRTAAYATLGLARLDTDRLERRRARAPRALRDATRGRLRHARRRRTGAGSRTRSRTTTHDCRRR